MERVSRKTAGFDVVQAGEGPELLLLHSLLSERSVFDRALPDLAARFRITIPNLPGYGPTPPLPDPAPSIDDYADAIGRLMDEAGLPEDTAVLGNGDGGFMAVALANRPGGRIGRLIMAGTRDG